MRRARIRLADDQRVLIDLLVKLLQPHFDLAGTVSDGLALLSTAQQLKRDVIVIDIGMPKLDLQCRTSARRPASRDQAAGNEHE